MPDSQRCGPGVARGAFGGEFERRVRNVPARVKLGRWPLQPNYVIDAALLL